MASQWYYRIGEQKLGPVSSKELRALAKSGELDGEDARKLLAGGCKAVSEGANMPSTAEAIGEFHNAKILFAPGKASNAGGVGVSGLEQSQNALRIAWSAEEVEGRLKEMMKGIYEKCVKYGKGEDGYVKVADAMLAYGVV